MMSLLLLQLSKASGNIKFICQQLYTFALIKELGLDQNTTSKSKTYTEVKKTNDQVSHYHTTFLKDTFNLEVDEKNKKLPNIY